MKKVDITIDLDACWEWNAATDKDGYGVFILEGRTIRAHRLAFFIKHGRFIKTKRLVCHKCDNPPCCNPKHLRLGTPLSNMLEKTLRGRTPSGETHSNSKLTEKLVRSFLTSISNGSSIKEAANKENIPYERAWRIAKRLAWKHVQI